MNYFVQWTPSAHDKLERIWMAAGDNAVVLRAANLIDDMLAADPFSKDVIFAGEENTFIVEPLAVEFHIDESRHRVVILAVWMLGFLEDNSH